MAAIPCLRGGFACFEDDLEAVGWATTQDQYGSIWAKVPDGPESARVAVEQAVDECRRDLLGMIAYFNDPETERKQADEYPERLAFLERTGASHEGKLYAKHGVEIARKDYADELATFEAVVA